MSVTTDRLLIKPIGKAQQKEPNEMNINFCHVYVSPKLTTSSTTYLVFTCPRQTYGCMQSPEISFILILVTKSVLTNDIV